MSVKGFLKDGKIEKYDYNALENKPSGSGGTGLTEEAKQALLQCFQKVAYIDANGQTYYQALYDALYATPKVLTSINASYTQSGEVLTTDLLDSLRKDIVVTAYYSDSTSATVTDYSLSGNLTAGTSTVTVYYNGQTDTISVTVTAVAGTYTISNRLTGCTTSNSATTITEGGSYTATITANNGYTLTGATASITMGGNEVTGAYSNGTISIANVTGDIVITVTAAARTITSISVVFNQGTNKIYDTDSLNDLKRYLIVTANYSDGGSATVPATDYTLQGQLDVGVDTITVSYSGKTTTFTVTVSEYEAPDTTAVIAEEGKVWSKTTGATTSSAGFGITQWYPYEFTQEALEACKYWDATNGYMNTSGWAGIGVLAPDYLTYQAGYSWPASSNYKHESGKDEIGTNWYSINRNALTTCQYGRYSTSSIATNGFSASVPLLDKDYAYAYWRKPLADSIFPTGVTDGDIIFAGKYTPYYGLTNIKEAASLTGITAAFNQGSTVVMTSTALSALKPMLEITAEYSNGKELPVNLGMVTLSGELTVGTSIITATYNEKTATFNVTVSEE